MQPLVSVIIPVYNGANYMREAIDSALAQTYKNIEIVVINDGSTDNTREIALSYGDKIRYFEKENGGVSTALNLGIRQMRGEYFSWLSHDDIYMPNKIERQIRAVQSFGNECLAVGSRLAYLDMPERNVEVKYCSETIRKWMDLSKMEQLGIKVLFFLGMIGCELLIPKMYFSRYGFFDENLHCVQDTMKWYQMFRENKIIYIDDVLVLSRRHDEQVSNTNPHVIQERNIYWKYVVDTISDYTLENLGWSRYQFYVWSLLKMMPDLNRYLYEKILDLNTELCESWKFCDAKILDKKRMNLLKTIPIYIYCAGRRGRRLALHLRLLGIDPIGFSDSDDGKWWSKIDGIQCIPPKQIPLNSCVIVTKLDSNELQEELKKIYHEVIDYADIELELMNWPIQRNVLKKYENIILNTV